MPSKGGEWSPTQWQLCFAGDYVAAKRGRMNRLAGSTRAQPLPQYATVGQRDETSGAICKRLAPVGIPSKAY